MINVFLTSAFVFFFYSIFHTHQAAEMAQRLSGINRWCISGTPVQRGLEGNVYGFLI